MKWDLDFTFVISRGRHRFVVFDRLFPFLRSVQQRHKDFTWSCYRKTRFHNEQAALNAGWFKKHTAKHRAYLCEVCDGWHIATL